MTSRGWTCTNCTFVHKAPGRRCSMCQLPRVSKADMESFVQGQPIPIVKTINSSTSSSQSFVVVHKKNPYATKRTTTTSSLSQLSQPQPFTTTATTNNNPYKRPRPATTIVSSSNQPSIQQQQQQQRRVNPYAKLPSSSLSSTASTTTNNNNNNSSNHSATSTASTHHGQRTATTTTAAAAMNPTTKPTTTTSNPSTSTKQQHQQRSNRAPSTSNPFTKAQQQQQQQQQNRSKKRVSTKSFIRSTLPYQHGPIPYDPNTIQTWIYPQSNHYPKRTYQFEMAQCALFENTLVSLPTGLGKTLIAAVVLYNYYRWFPTGKVLFLAPTLPLVDQQLRACFQIMGIPLSDTALLTGKVSSDNRTRIWQSKRVFFCTPQTVHNDLESNRVSATDFCCVVLDEVHKATGDFAYVKVVQFLEANGAKFRLLGLSATPGTSIQNIQTVIDTLRINRVQARSDTDPDVAPYIFDRHTELLVVETASSTRTIQRLLNASILDPLLNKLRDYGVLRHTGNATVTAYNVLRAKESFCQRHPESNSHPQRGPILGNLAAAQKFTQLRADLHRHGIGVVRQKLQTMMREPQRGIVSTIVKSNDFKALCDLVHTSSTRVNNDGTEIHDKLLNNPKLLKLQQVLVEHFQRARACDTSSRAIVFSQFRDSVAEIVQVLERQRPILFPRYFVGQGKGGGGDKTKNRHRVQGMKQEEQKKVIQQFRDGLYNVLICTSIGEEGLDIGQVDLIVNFDCLSSPIRMIQRVGRTGRKRQGRVITLLSEGTEERTYKTSQLNERNLFHALKNPNSFNVAPIVPMLPHTPVLDERGMNVSQTEFHLSQVDGAQKTKRRRCEDARSLKLTDEQERRVETALGDLTNLERLEKESSNGRWPQPLRRRFLAARSRSYSSSSKRQQCLGRISARLRQFEKTHGAVETAFKRTGRVRKSRNAALETLFPMELVDPLDPRDSRTVCEVMESGVLLPSMARPDPSATATKRPQSVTTRSDGVSAALVETNQCEMECQPQAGSAEPIPQPPSTTLPSSDLSRHPTEQIEPRPKGWPEFAIGGETIEPQSSLLPAGDAPQNLAEPRRDQPLCDNEFEFRLPDDDSSSDSSDDELVVDSKRDVKEHKPRPFPDIPVRLDTNQQTCAPPQASTDPVSNEAVDPLCDDVFQLQDCDSSSDSSGDEAGTPENVTTESMRQGVPPTGPSLGKNPNASTKDAAEMEAPIFDLYDIDDDSFTNEVLLPETSSQRQAGASKSTEDEDCLAEQLVIADTPDSTKSPQLSQSRKPDIVSREGFVLSSTLKTPSMERPKVGNESNGSQSDSRGDTKVRFSLDTLDSLCNGRLNSNESKDSFQSVPRSVCLPDASSQELPSMSSNPYLDSNDDKEERINVKRTKSSSKKRIIDDTPESTRSHSSAPAAYSIASSRESLVLSNTQEPLLPENASLASCEAIICAVCLGSSVSNENPIVLCDGPGEGQECGVAVHVSCYSTHIDNYDLDWRCDRCEFLHNGGSPSDVRCSKSGCGGLHGAFKRENGWWLHLRCQGTKEHGLKRIRKFQSGPRVQSKPLEDNKRRPLANLPSNEDLEETNGDRRRRRQKVMQKYIDEEADADSDEDGDQEDEIRAIEDAEDELAGDFINDSSQLGYNQDDLDRAKLDEDCDATHRELDLKRQKQTEFATPMLNRRMQNRGLAEDTPSTGPDSQRGLGNCHFIRSVLEHHRNGGDAEDIERAYLEMEEEGMSATADDTEWD